MELGRALAPLATLRRFVNYETYPDPDRPAKTIKRPVDVTTGQWCNSNLPAHQYSFAEANATGRPVGFVFVEGDGYFFVDIDGALETTPAGASQWSAMAHDLCTRFAGAAVEVSQSGTGLHIIGRGKAPPHSCKNVPLKIELYTNERFCALTGRDAHGDASTDCTPALTYVAETYFPPNPHGEISGWTAEPVPEYGGPADDADLLRAAMASGKKNAANVFGKGNVTFADLWDADADKLAAKWPSEKGGYDASQADGALAGHLAYWTGKNHERTRELMFQSGLARQKWEDRPDWLDTTIMRAASVVSNVAKGRDPIPPPSALAGEGDAPALAGVSFDGDRPATTPRELIKGLLPVEGIAFLGGQSGAGKTFVAVDLAVALAAGTECEFFGRRVRERVGVAIIAAEGHGTLPDRLRVAKEHRGIVFPLPIAYFGLDLDLATEPDTAKLCEKLREIALLFFAQFGVRLGAVIIDTVAAAVGMENENDNAEAARTIRTLRRIGAETAALIMPIHHYGKTEDTGLRGASGFRAGADVVLSVLADRNKSTGIVSNRRLALAKSRTREEGPISGFDLAPIPIGLDEDGEVYGSCAVVPNANAAKPAHGAREPQSHRDFNAAYDAAIREHGIDLPAVDGQGTRRVAQLADVRTEFERRRQKADGDKRKQSDAARKAFSNAREALADKFSTWADDHSVDWISRID